MGKEVVSETSHKNNNTNIMFTQKAQQPAAPRMKQKPACLWKRDEQENSICSFYETPPSERKENVK